MRPKKRRCHSLRLRLDSQHVLLPGALAHDCRKARGLLLAHSGQLISLAVQQRLGLRRSMWGEHCGECIEAVLGALLPAHPLAVPQHPDPRQECKEFVLSVTNSGREREMASLCAEQPASEGRVDGAGRWIRAWAGTVQEMGRKGLPSLFFSSVSACGRRFGRDLAGLRGML